MDHSSKPKPKPKPASDSLRRATPSSNRFRTSQLLRFPCYYLLTTNVFSIRFSVTTYMARNLCVGREKERLKGKRRIPVPRERFSKLTARNSEGID